jgi:hypothetical protein
MATIGERPRLGERASGMKKIGSFRYFRQIARLLKERLGLS